jgi:hypothetical protein
MKDRKMKLKREELCPSRKNHVVLISILDPHIRPPLIPKRSRD